jgi:cell division protein FtsL
MTAQAIPHAGTRGRTATAAQAGHGPRIVPLAFFVLLVIGVFFLMIFLRVALDRSAFELDTIERQIASQESLQLDLRLELAQLQDPLRIANEATRLELIYPDQRVAVVVTGLNRADAEIATPIEETPVRALETETP